MKLIDLSDPQDDAAELKKLISQAKQVAARHSEHSVVSHEYDKWQDTHSIIISGPPRLDSALERLVSRSPLVKIISAKHQLGKHDLDSNKRIPDKDIVTFQFK